MRVVVRHWEITESPGTVTKTSRGTDSSSGSSDIAKELDSLSPLFVLASSALAPFSGGLPSPGPNISSSTSQGCSFSYSQPLLQQHCKTYSSKLNFTDVLGPTWSIPKPVVVAGEMGHSDWCQPVRTHSRNWTWDRSCQNHIVRKTVVQLGRGAGKLLVGARAAS